MSLSQMDLGRTERARHDRGHGSFERPKHPIRSIHRSKSVEYGHAGAHECEREKVGSACVRNG